MKRHNLKGVIREYFFVNPSAKLRVRQIEKELEVPLPSVIKYVRELERDEILKTISTGNVVFYSADRSSRKFLLEKKLFNIRRLYDSGLISFLITELSNPVIVVFGSYSKGEDVESSDIDLYLETPSRKELDLEGFESALKRKIHVFAYSSMKKDNPHLANNIMNGVILNGFVEVFK